MHCADRRDSALSLNVLPRCTTLRQISLGFRHSGGDSGAYVADNRLVLHFLCCFDTDCCHLDGYTTALVSVPVTGI